RTGATVRGGHATTQADRGQAEDLDPLPAGAYRPDRGQRTRQVQRRLQVVGERGLPPALRPDPSVAGRNSLGPGRAQLLRRPLADLGAYDQVVHPRIPPRRATRRGGGASATWRSYVLTYRHLSDT